MKLIALICFLLPFLNNDLYGCSAIIAAHNGSFVVGANLDGEGIWEGLVFINKTGVEKQTDFEYDDGKTLQWVSQYGSVTFNLLCREYAQYGMNTEGLIVTTVSCLNSCQPYQKDLPELNGNFWVQYILDKCKSVKEVKETFSKINVLAGNDRYMICDRFGGSIIIEFHDGVVFYENENMPIPILTNQLYQKSIMHVANNTLPSSDKSFDFITTKRFIRANDELKPTEYTLGDNKISRMFGILKKIQGYPESIWRIVFDQQEAKVYFMTHANKSQRFINLDEIDFSCQSDKVMANIDAGEKGDFITELTKYSYPKNYELYQTTMNNLGREITNKAIERHINYLDSFNCIN